MTSVLVKRIMYAQAKAHTQESPQENKESIHLQAEERIRETVSTNTLI